MPEKNTPLLTQYKTLFGLINDARTTMNPFRAKELKAQIEPKLERFALGCVQTISSQENQINDLQKQIGRLDARLSDLGG
jgi:hypothetical protein